MKDVSKSPNDHDILDKDMLEIMLSEIPPIQHAIPSEKIWERIAKRAHLSTQTPESELVADTYTIQSDEGDWRSITPLVQMKVLRDDGKTRTFLLKLSPGAKLPAHDHAMEEECLVLEGDAYIGGEEVFAGDYHLAHVGSKHGILGSRNGALLLLRGECR